MHCWIRAKGSLFDMLPVMDPLRSGIDVYEKLHELGFVVWDTKPELSAYAG